MLSSASDHSLSLWAKEVRMERVVANVRRHRIYRIAVDPFFQTDFENVLVHGSIRVIRRLFP